MQKFIKTKRKNYTTLEVVDLFSKHVRPENLEILVNHLTYPELSHYIVSFTEIDGDVCFNIGQGNELIKVTKK